MGRPYGWIISARARGEGTHKGCPYGWIISARARGEGTHKGCPYGWIIRARTRGVPTRFRQPQWGQMECGGGVALWVGRQLANMATSWRRGVFLEGALRGESPRTREGRRPDRPNGRSPWRRLRSGDRQP